MAGLRSRCGMGIIGLVSIIMLPVATAQSITPGSVQDTLKRPPAEVAPIDALQAPSNAPVLRPDEGINVPAKTISVDHFEFAGNTLYADDVLNRLVNGYTQRQITLVELYEAADKVTDFYVKQGYTLASVVVPAQKVTEGMVRLEVIEGHIGKLKYQGLKRYQESDLGYFLDTPEGQVYRASVFEKSLRLVDGLPGLDVKARLQPGEAYGSSDIVVEAAETPIEGSVFVDNGGTRNIGVIRTGAQVTLNAPLRAADQLTLLALRSREGLLKYGSVGYSVPTGLSASRINFTYGYAKFKVAGAFAGVSGSNRNAKAEFYVPLLKTSINQLDLSAAVSDTRANADFSGISFNKSAITLLELGSTYVHTFPNRAAAQVTGLISSNFRDYDNQASVNQTQPLKLDLDLQQLTPLPWYRLQLLTRTQLVYGVSPLPDTQKFSIGGPSSVRGYAPSEARGDWGYLGQVTLRRNIPFGPVVVTPRLFYDVGVIRQHHLNRLPPGSQPPDVSLASYGFGADAGFHSLSVKLDYAVPTTNVPVSDGKEDGRFYGTFSLAF